MARAPSTEELATGRGRMGGASPKAVEHALQEGGKRITQIDEWTRKQIMKRVSQAVEQGMSPAEAGAFIRNWSGFDEYRAERIARTEMMFSFNASAAVTYAEYGVQEVVADDGDEDPECAARHGQVFTVDEALGIEDHPNGTLDWLPVAPERGAQAIQGQLHEVRPIASLAEPAPASIVDALPVPTPAIPHPTIDLSDLPVVHGPTTALPYQNSHGKWIVETKNSGKMVKVDDGWVHWNDTGPSGSIPNFKPTAGDTWSIAKDPLTGKYVAKEWASQEVKYTWHATKGDWEPVGSLGQTPQLPTLVTSQDYDQAAAILTDLEDGKSITAQQMQDLMALKTKGAVSDADIIQATSAGQKVTLKKQALDALDDIAQGKSLGGKEALVNDAISQGLISQQQFKDAAEKGLQAKVKPAATAKPQGMSPQAEGDWQWMKDHGWTQGMEADGTFTMHPGPATVAQGITKPYYLNPDGAWDTVKKVKPSVGGSAPPSVGGQALNDVQQLQGWTWSQDPATGMWAYIHPDKTWGMELSDDGTHWTKSIQASSHQPAAPPAPGGTNVTLQAPHVPGAKPDIQVSGYASGNRVSSANYRAPKGRLIDHLPAEKPEPLADYTSIMTKRPKGGAQMSVNDAKRATLGDGDTLLNRDIYDDLVHSHQSDWAGSSQSDFAWAAKEAAARDGMVTLNPYEQGAINDVRARLGAVRWDEAVATAQRMQQYQRTRVGRIVDPDQLITVYRGVRLQDTGWAVDDIVDFDGGALSSWSLSRTTAESFASGGYGGKKGYVLESRVRARDVAGTPGVSGMGTFYEQELVLYGGRRQAKVLRVNG